LLILGNEKKGMMAKYIDVMMLVIRFKFKDVGCCGRDTLVRGSEVAECSY